MIEESATVLTCEAEFAIVETQVKAACGACQAEHSCSTSVLSSLFKRRHSRLRVLNPIQAMPGQRVIIGLPEQALVNLSLISYLLPLLWMILLAIGAEKIAVLFAWKGVELMSISGGLLGLTIGLLLLRRFSHRSQHDASYQATILRQETSKPVQFSSAAVSRSS